MRKNPQKIVFENIGGSFQFNARKAEDLYKILELDATAWAALCVPTASLNGDPEFFKALDEDNNGMIRADEVKKAISWLLDVLKNIQVLNARQAVLHIDDLNIENSEAETLYKFVRKHANELLDEKDSLQLDNIRKKISAVTSGALLGDGILRSKAVNDAEARGLFNALTTLLATREELTLPQLEKFAADAAAFVQWSKTAQRPAFRNDDPVKYYEAYKALADKIDEYFRFCELIRIDQAHAARFTLNPAQLPPLDLQDTSAIDQLLLNAPLVVPAAEAVLVLNESVNPCYRQKIDKFSETFGIKELTTDSWAKIKADLAPYIDYLAKAQGDTAGQLGKEALEKYLAGTAIDELRKLFVQDQELGSVLENLRKLERLLLYSCYMLEFVNNFVSFETFFDPCKISMLQAGRVVMDGKSYNLAVWIDNIAAHKKIAVRSGLCLLYLEVTSSGAKAVTRKLAVAITGGSLNRIYVGKPAFFVDNDQVSYHGKIVDMVEGPISFGQTILAPFRRLSEALSNKLQKLTDFSSTEKELSTAIDKGKLPAPRPAAPQPDMPWTQRFMNNHSMMLLAGGLSLAAIGAGFSFIVKGLGSICAAISAQPFYVILIWIAVILGIIIVPMAIFAFLQLRKRNITLFLEAGGWAVNLPMRLNIHLSGIFTHKTAYPKQAVFKVVKYKKSSRTLYFTLLVLITLAAAAAALWYLHRY